MEYYRNSFKKMNKFIGERNKKFIIIGIDNAFTIDEDVREVWTDDPKL